MNLKPTKGEILPISTDHKSTLHVYDNYAWLHGFSVVPSWGARIEEAWWFYDGARMREEVSLAKQVHANCIRLWIEFTAWMADPDKVTANFLDAVSAIDEAGMKTMPRLFNRWRDNLWDYGGTYRSPEDLAKKLATYKEVQQRHGKPFLVNETIPGGLDDLRRAELAKYYTEQLFAAGFGWLGWALREGKAISTRRDRYDEHGPKFLTEYPGSTCQGIGHNFRIK